MTIGKCLVEIGEYQVCTSYVCSAYIIFFYYNVIQDVLLNFTLFKLLIVIYDRILENRQSMYNSTFVIKCF